MKLRRGIALAAVVAAGLAVGLPVSRHLSLQAVRPGWDSSRRFTLPNGWRLTPAGETFALPGDMPATILFLDQGTKALVNTCGFHDPSVSLVDLQTKSVIKTAALAHSWIGMATTPTGEVWVSGGSATNPARFPTIHRLNNVNDLTEIKGLELPELASKERFVSSLLAGAEGMYCVNIQTDQVFLLDEAGAVKHVVKVGYRPYGLALSPDRSTLAVSNWGDRSVSLLDAHDLHLLASVEVGPMPSSMAYAPDGRLFVSESGSDTVAVLRGQAVTARIKTGLDKYIALGATPVGMGLSPDGRTLYVANAGNNCLTVVDVRPGRGYRVEGFIPTERYPTAVAVTPDGQKLLVATAKGYYGANVLDANGSSKGRRSGGGIPHKYIGDQLEGRLAVISVPDRQGLAELTRKTIENQPRGVEAAPGPEQRHAIEQEVFKKIKHVIYVIRENRTYDQVLGDLPRGNGDSRLTLFGQKVTPNGHKIATQFVTLDNLYTDGEVSQIGHQWTDSAYGNDYTEHQWILEYSGKGEVVSDPRLSSSPGEYLWTQARKHGVSARVFGEYVNVQEDHGSLANPTIKADPEKYGFSAPFEEIFARHGRDTEKVDEFLGEMHQAEKVGKWPSLMVMALPEDHTRGLSAGAFSPRAMVANNDLAVGRLIAEVSHSRFWKETAIFVIEDDAQDGPDHVDSHRTEGLIVSPYLQRGIVDSTQYSTSSMLRTMELILGLPPMTQYDAKTTPMYASFTAHPDFAPYELEQPQTDVNEVNPARTALAKRSAGLDFSDIDRADANELNHILWEAYRPGQPYPTRRP